MTFLFRTLLLCFMVQNLACSTSENQSSQNSTPTYEIKEETFQQQIHAEGYLKAVTSTSIKTPQGNNRLTIAWVQDNGASVKKGDVVVRFDPAALEKKLSDSESRKELVSTDLAAERLRTQSANNERTRSSAMAKQDLKIAKERASEKDSAIFSRNEINASQIDGKLSEAKVIHSTATIKIDQSISRKKLKLLALQKETADRAIKMAKSGLDKMQVLAPHDGIFVHRGSGLKAGDTMWPGRELANLPLVSSMQAEVFVLEADVMGLSEGLKASLQVESHLETTFEASIEKLSAQAEPRQEEVPTLYFALTLKIEETDTQQMKPGSRVIAKLFLDDIEKAVVVPRQCVFEVDGSHIVYKKQGQIFQPTPVTLGVGTPGRVVIQKGLSAGDFIATKDPTLSGQKNRAQKEKGVGQP